ncbi:MAG TPA: hypothetical protein VFG08_03060 [Candidatus Polarisedimenticolia bacterium]|nr:hypothetical protein [Candidatus Polarisedimenticolia bacterium]
MSHPKASALMGMALALITAACGPAPVSDGGAQEATQQTAATTRTVPPGTELEAALTTTLDSGTNRVGDTFVATVTEPVQVDSEPVIEAGSKITGRLTEVKAAKRGAGNASLTLRFDSLILPQGEVVPITASFSQSTDSMKKRNSAIIGGSAAGGAILGRILGEESEDALVGAVVGGAVGTGVVLAQEGAQVRLPAGTVLVLELGEPLHIPQA